MDVALASCVTLPEPDPDQALLEQALAAAGLEVATLAWDDPSVDWRRARRTVMRSTWNYIHHLEAFLAWTARTASESELWNDPATVRWNVHKSYLLELAAHGVPVVPTRLCRRGERLVLDELLQAWPTLVVKPAVSAGSFATIRVERATLAAGQAHLDALARTRDVLVQRYLPSVTGHGERALVWIDGELTHAVRKSPRFQHDHESVSEAVAIGDDEAELAGHVLAAVPQRPRYARIDMAPDGDGRPVLMELELIEPSLFLGESPPALQRFARAIARGLD